MTKSTELRVTAPMHSSLTDFLGFQSSISWPASKDRNIIPTLLKVNLMLRKLTDMPTSHGWKSWRPDVSLDPHYYPIQALLPKTSEFIEKVWVVEK